MRAPHDESLPRRHPQADRGDSSDLAADDATGIGSGPVATSAEAVGASETARPRREPFVAFEAGVAGSNARSRHTAAAGPCRYGFGSGCASTANGARAWQLRWRRRGVDASLTRQR